MCLWCPTHIVLCFCFVFLRLLFPVLPVSLVFSNVYLHDTCHFSKFVLFYNYSIWFCISMLMTIYEYRMIIINVRYLFEKLYQSINLLQIHNKFSSLLDVLLHSSSYFGVKNRIFIIQKSRVRSIIDRLSLRTIMQQ